MPYRLWKVEQTQEAELIRTTLISTFASHEDDVFCLDFSKRALYTGTISCRKPIEHKLIDRLLGAFKRKEA